MTKQLEAAKVLLEEAALRYARFRTFGVVIQDNGNVSTINTANRTEYEESFLRELGERAVAVLLEMTLPEITK